MQKKQVIDFNMLELGSNYTIEIKTYYGFIIKDVTFLGFIQENKVSLEIHGWDKKDRWKPSKAVMRKADISAIANFPVSMYFLDDRKMRKILRDQLKI